MRCIYIESNLRITKKNCRLRRKEHLTNYEYGPCSQFWQAAQFTSSCMVDFRQAADVRNTTIAAKEKLFYMVLRGVFAFF